MDETIETLKFPISFDPFEGYIFKSEAKQDNYKRGIIAEENHTGQSTLYCSMVSHQIKAFCEEEDGEHATAASKKDTIEQNAHGHHLGLCAILSRHNKGLIPVRK